MKRIYSFKSLLMIVGMLMLLFGVSYVNTAQAATSGDAYANYDSATNTWTMGTGTIEKKVQLTGGNIRMTRLYNKLTSREMLQNSQTGVEFQISANGTYYNGNSGGWILDSQVSDIGSQTSVTQDITIHNALLTVKLHYIIWPSTGVIEQYIEYTNRTASNMAVNDPEIMDTNVMASDMASGTATFTYFTGGQNTSDALHLVTVATSSVWSLNLQTFNYGSNEFLQEVIYRNTTTNDGVLLGWSSSSPWFSALGGNGRVQVDAYGANGTTLAAGATYSMPLTHTMVYKGDLDDAGNAFKDFQYRYKWDVTNDRWVGVVKPFLWNYGNNYDNTTTFNLTQNYRYVGADIFHWDADWYDKQGDWNNIKTTNMAQLNNFAKKNGMDLMVWMPVYSAESSSAVLTANPSWATSTTNCAWGAGLNMNLSNNSVEGWMLDKLNSKTTELGDWIWRQDMGGGAWDGSGVNQINASNNFFKLMSDFKKKNPYSGININQCGGRQMSLEAFHYGEITQTSDMANGHYSVYTPSYLFPPDKLWGTVKEEPGANNALWTDSQTVLRGMLASDWEWNGDGTPTASQLEAFRINADIYRFMKSTGLVGRYVKIYHPEVNYDDKTYYIQRMSNDNTKGVIIPMHDHTDPGGKLVTVYPKGLTAASNYTVKFQNSGYQVTNTGSYWMTNGIGQANWGGNLVWLNVTNYPGALTDTTAPASPSSVTKKSETNMFMDGVALNWNSGTDNNWVSHYDIYINNVFYTKVVKENYVFIPAGNIGDTYQVRTVDGDGNVSGFVTAAATVNDSGSSIGFSSTQGSNQWSYKETSNLITYTNMTWDSVNSRWQGTGYSIIAQGWQHPDATIKSARTWTAPTSGVINLMATVKKGTAGLGGNGVNVKIMKGSTQIWPAGTGYQLIAATDQSGYFVNQTVLVTAGDPLYFIVDSNGDVSNDQTAWDIRITYPATLDNTDASITYSGIWGVSTGLSTSTWYNGTAGSSNTTNSYFQYTCTSCKNIKWLSTKGPDRGQADVYVDGIFKQTIDAYASVLSSTSVIFDTRELKAGSHMLKVVVKGVKNASSTNYWIENDAIHISN